MAAPASLPAHAHPVYAYFCFVCFSRFSIQFHITSFVVVGGARVDGVLCLLLRSSEVIHVVYSSCE